MSLDYATVKEALENVRSAADVPNLVVGADEFVAIHVMATAFERGLSSSEAQIRQQSEELSRLVTQKVSEWSDKERLLLQTVDAQKAALEAQGINVNTAYIAELTQNEAKLQGSLKNLQTWVSYLESMLPQRDNLVANRWASRDAMFQKRRAFASAATKKSRDALTDLNVSLKFERNAHSPQAQDLLVEVMQWRTTQVARVPAIIRRLTVPGLINAILAKDTRAIQALVTDEGVPIFDRQDAQNIIDRFSEHANLARLQTVAVYDRPYLTVTREQTDSSGGRTFKVREFAQLSLGQQQSVLLALMLSSDNPNPLLIDQPEDNLDSQFIYSQLVPVIRRAKERRQIIVVTHNPNIAILGDAEQIIVLAANNEQAVVTSRGSVDSPDTKEAACGILEGARAAFVRRGKAYGVS
jgi:predicted ATP-dependent endonuclease of OLD family